MLNRWNFLKTGFYEGIIPHLRDGMTVLDVGCGPGTITCGIAESIVGGQVVGLDVDESQVRLAAEAAASRGTRNLEFRAGSAYDLPVPAESFELVFAHALLEHLKDSAVAIVEFRRVLQAAGTLAVCSPDWGGFLLAPSSKELAQAIDAYKILQTPERRGCLHRAKALSPAPGSRFRRHSDAGAVRGLRLLGVYRRVSRRSA